MDSEPSALMSAAPGRLVLTLDRPRAAVQEVQHRLGYSTTMALDNHGFSAEKEKAGA